MSILIFTGEFIEIRYFWKGEFQVHWRSTEQHADECIRQSGKTGVRGNEAGYAFHSFSKSLIIRENLFHFKVRKISVPFVVFPLNFIEEKQF